MSRRIGMRPISSPPTITMSSRLAAGGGMVRAGAGGAASGASPWSGAADVVLAFPFVLESQTAFTKVFWVNGSAAGGTADVAIYDDAYRLIVGTGAATTCVGNNVPQAVALTATTTLPPGLYYAGMTKNDTTTGRVFRWSLATTGAAFWQALGCWKSTDAGPINLDATPADMTDVAFPVFGLITRSVFDV